MWRRAKVHQTPPPAGRTGWLDPVDPTHAPFPYFWLCWRSEHDLPDGVPARSYLGLNPRAHAWAARIRRDADPNPFLLPTGMTLHERGHWQPGTRTLSTFPSLLRLVADALQPLATTDPRSVRFECVDLAAGQAVAAAALDLLAQREPERETVATAMLALALDGAFAEVTALRRTNDVAVRDATDAAT